MAENKLEFADVQNQRYRTYVFPSTNPGKTVEITIAEPVKIAISNSGIHRIVDDAGKTHVVQPGWIHLYWEEYI
jgi:hypothetical protein